MPSSILPSALNLFCIYCLQMFALQIQHTLRWAPVRLQVEGGVSETTQANSLYQVLVGLETSRVGMWVSKRREGAQDEARFSCA